MKRILAVVFVLVALPLAAGEPAPGWEYQKNGGVHLFQIRPEAVRIDLMTADLHEAAAIPAKGYRERSGALLVVNGGFFDESFRSLGLIVRRGVEVNPLRPVDWGIFLVTPAGPAIVHRRDLEKRKEGIETALQVGPRLVVDGKIPPLKKDEPSRRAAVGLMADGRILIALSEAMMTMQEWARLLQSHAPQVLNLDGGGSAQLSAKIGDFSLEIAGTTGVPNALGFFAKD